VFGAKNAEDLVHLTGTPWIVASDFNLGFVGPANATKAEWRFGPLEAIRIDTHEVRRLYPTPESAVDWDRKMYPDCPSPPESLSSHGLNVRRLGPDMYRLFVANHGGRQSVEVIDVRVQGGRLSTTWRGGILAPEWISPNGVVPLPGGGIALSGVGVGIWRPGRGWNRVEGVTGGNGIELSKDGKWLFIAVDDVPDKSVVRVPVAGGPAQTVLRIDGFAPDNLRWGEDGCLYLAGQFFPKHFQEADWMAAFKRPILDVGFGVVQIDAETLAAKEIFRSEGIKDAFGAATTALQVGACFWVGTFHGDRIAILALKP
jgi:hypothetical protein